MFDLTPSAVAMVRAIFGMGALTMVMAAWQVGTRMPAMRKAGLDLKAATHVVDLNAALPSSARRVNDNYNHLLEAPTVFYAMCSRLSQRVWQARCTPLAPGST